MRAQRVRPPTYCLRLSFHFIPYTHSLCLTFPIHPHRTPPDIICTYTLIVLCFLDFWPTIVAPTEHCHPDWHPSLMLLFPQNLIISHPKSSSFDTFSTLAAWGRSSFARFVDAWETVQTPHKSSQHLVCAAALSSLGAFTPFRFNMFSLCKTKYDCKCRYLYLLLFFNYNSFSLLNSFLLPYL